METTLEFLRTEQHRSPRKASDGSANCTASRPNCEALIPGSSQRETGALRPDPKRVVYAIEQAASSRQ